MASREQIRIIHSLKSALKLTEDEYRSLLSGYEVESSKDLSFETAADVIRNMTKNAQSAGVWTQKPGRSDRSERYEHLDGRARNMASPAQLRMIEGLWNDVSYVRDPDKQRKALRTFLERFDVSALEFVKTSLVPKILRALEHMKAKQRQAPKKAA